MAKRVTQSDPAAEEELSVVVLKFKGSGETIRKGVDAAMQAIAALGGSTTIVKQVNGRKPAQLGTGAAAEDSLDTEAIETEDGDDAADAAPAARPASAKKARVPYTFMDDFNLAPNSKTSWSDYVTEHGSPDGVEDRFMLASAWAQIHGGADPFTGGHLFTLFRAQKWPTQADMTQPLRKMKSRKSYYDNPEFGKWRMTGIGLTDAEKIGKS